MEHALMLIDGGAELLRQLLSVTLVGVFAISFVTESWYAHCEFANYRKPGSQNT